MMKTGFCEVNINPPLGIGVGGYYIPRFAKGIIDDITASALVLEVSDKRIAIISVDVCSVAAWRVEQYQKLIYEKTGIPSGNIFITATHTHTSALIIPATSFKADDDVIVEYGDFVGERIADAVLMAIDDLKPAKMGYIVGYAPERVAYIRRYKMKDGSTMTCPPVNSPDIDYPIGELDKRVNVLRFDREGAESVVLVNYGLHADTVNGEMLSSDWPGWMKKTLDKALDGVKCIFIAGAEGDVGSTNVYPKDGDMNDTEISFDNEMKSPGMARFVGRAIAGTVLQVYDKVCYVPVDSIEILRKTVVTPANYPTPEQIPLAREYKKLHEEGRDSEIPYKAMELTTVVAEALRICRMENGPKEFELPVTGLRIGNVALIGLPGEPFTEIGVRIKEIGGYDLIMPCALTNASEGYFPVKSAFDEGGYEARTSRFTGSVADDLVNGAREVLKELKK